MRVCILCAAPRIDDFPSLPASEGLRVVGWVTTGTGYVERIKALAPEIVVIDLRTEPARTDEIVGAVTTAMPQVRVLVVGASGALDAARAALSRGVSGYVTRDGSRAGLMFALNALAQGGAYITATGRRAIRATAAEPTDEATDSAASD